jgi:DNA-binding protein HU-beta
VVNKSEVVQDVAGTAGVSRQDVEKVIDAFFDTVRVAVGKGDRVAWPSFGSFSSTDRQARTGRNPRTGEPVPIAASRAVKFSASTALKAALNPPKPKKAAKKTTAAKKTAAPAKSSGSSAAKGAATKAPAKKATKKK